MKNNYLLFPASAFLLLLFLGCNKSENDQDTSAQSLLLGKWKITGYTQVSNGTSSDYYVTMPPCAKDNVITYSSNNNVSLDEGATKCNQSDPQLVSETYTINGSQITTYTGDEGDDLDQGTIISLTSTTLIISFDGGAPNDKGIITYTRQP